MRPTKHLPLCLSILTLTAVAADWWTYPGKISIAKVQGKELEVIVTKKSRLPDTFVPNGLVALPDEVIRTTKPVQIRRELLDPLKKLRQAAHKDGIDLVVLSGYRSFARQKEVHQYWINYEKGNRVAAEKYSARPGHSEHQLGTVVDFSTNEINDAIGPRFHNTKAAAWLRKNAESFGFKLSYPKDWESQTGYQWESWHWRWWPQKKAPSDVASPAE
jgi:D-alanyl-D-alanine carboxypeptidase